MDIVLQNARCITLFPPAVGSFDLRISRGTITDRKKHIQPGPGDEVHDLNGRIVMPGLVCAHTHLYSSLSRGMPPAKRPPVNFPDILKRIWWKLDRALDEESIYYSALSGAIEAVMCGTTTIVDHHASPGSIGGSLDIIKEAMEKVGLRGVLCYEVTDRGGKKKRDEGLQENERFIRATAGHAMFRGLVGAHASFTLSDESLGLCGRMASDLGTGVHIHAAEDLSDVKDARHQYQCGIMERFVRHGIVKQGSILAHGVHLTAQEIETAEHSGSMLVHNPRSNMNNRVGYAPVELFGRQGALGTDGFPADMFEEASFGFFKNQDSQASMNAGPRQDGSVAGIQRAAGETKERKHRVEMTQLLDGGQRIASEQFGRAFGAIDKGAAADLIVLNYQPPTPLSKDNCAGHFLFGMRSSIVESVMIEGRWIMKDRVIAGIDTVRVHEESRMAAKKLWERMNG